VTTLLMRNTQTVHAILGENLMPYNMTANMAYAAHHIDISNTTDLAALNAALTDQAMMVAYIDDYQFIMFITLAVVPLLFLMRAPKKEKSPDEPIVME